MTKATTTDWNEVVTAWRASGKSAQAFARDRGISAATLRWWSTERERHERAKSSSVKVARVVRSSPKAVSERTDPCLDVYVRHARISVREGFDSKLLRAVVDALGGASIQSSTWDAAVGEVP
jgi:hypothetical protein